MGVHRPISLHLFTLNGNVLTSGGAKNLAKGQFTIVNSAKGGANGAAVVGDFAGLPADTVFEMRLGKHRVPNSRTALNSKPYASHNFKAKDVVSVKANFPKITKQTFDDLIIGYDGINVDTAISLDENQTTVLDITLSGDHVGFATGECKHVIKLHFGREAGQTNQEVLEGVAKRLKEYKLPMGVPVTELIDIKVVNSENLPLAGVPYVFSSLALTDNGDSNALALVQAQYPSYRVVRSNRMGLISEYTILHPQTVSLANYTSTVPTYKKDCADCAAGYELIAGGVVYSVKIEDDGADLTTTVDDLPGFVTGSVVKVGQVEGFGSYTVVLDNALTDAEIATFLAASAVKSTAIISFLGDINAVCYDDTVTSTAWVAGNVCYASVENYKIQLKDDDCDGSRLAELQAAYPELTIEAGVPTGEASRALTLTGTGGTANVAVNGVNYLATFDTNLTTTASNFVTAHAADILEATGAVVTADAGVLTFVDSATGFPTITITNATTNLAGTLGAIDYLTTASAGGCQRVYSTQVTTNIVCDECDPIFVGQFSSEAPQAYDLTEWVLVPSVAPSETAKMGLRLTGKPFIWYPTDISRDQIPFYETSTRISVSGGYVEEVNNSFDPIFSDIFEVTRLSRAQDRDNLGGHLMGHEERSRTYFDGEVRHRDNLYAKAVLGEESVLEFSKQYVSYEITIHDSRYSQGVGRTSDMGMTYIVWAEYGRQSALEDYINKLAAKAGVEPASIQ